MIGGVVRFHVAGQVLTSEPVVAVDLVAFSTVNNLETDGVLGYPALRHSVLTVEYRDARIRIEAPSSGGNASAVLADRKDTGFR